MARITILDYLILVFYEAAAISLFTGGTHQQVTASPHSPTEVGRILFEAASWGTVAYGSYLLVAKGWGIGLQVKSLAVHYWTVSGAFLTTYLLVALGFRLGSYFPAIGHSSMGNVLMVLLLLSQVTITLLGAASLIALPVLFLIDVCSSGRQRESVTWGLISLIVCLLYYWGTMLVCGMRIPWWCLWWGQDNQ